MIARQRRLSNRVIDSHLVAFVFAKQTTGARQPELPVLSSDVQSPAVMRSPRQRSGPSKEPAMNLRLISVAIALVVSAMLLGAAVYESVVLAPNLQGAPASLEHARGFYHVTNPGVFFRVLSPATQLFLLFALVCNWKPIPGTRWQLATALVLAILADVITFKFHYPRNAILFSAPLTNTSADL